MRKVLAIFEKDARHLWPQIAAFWALVAAAAALDPVYTHRRPLPAEGLVWTALPLACWILVMAAIHEDRLPGDRQYWLTRPYSRAGLAAAKALFVAVFVNLPALVAHAAVMAVLGIPPWHHMTVLAWQQFYLTAFAILPAAAIASVTTGLRQVILAAVVIVVPLFVGTTAISFLTRHPVFFFRPGTGSWLQTAGVAAVLMVGAAAVLWLQYGRRATGWSRTLAAGVVLAVVIAGGAVHKDQTFAVQAWLTPGPWREAAVQVVLDPDANRAADPQYSRERRVYGVAHLEIPVRLAGPAPDSILLPGINARAAIQGGPILSGEVREQPAGQWWLSIDLPGGYFKAIRNNPVDLDGSLDVTVFQRGVSLPAPQRRAEVTPGVGVCEIRRDFEEQLALECYSPWPAAALALEFPDGGRQWIISRFTADLPIPSADEFATMERFSSPTPFGSLEELAPLRLITEVPTGHLRVRYRLAGIRLADFAYPR